MPTNAPLMPETCLDLSPATAAPNPSRDDINAAVALLEANGDFRILRRFIPPIDYSSAPDSSGLDDPLSTLRRFMVLDTETTGLDPKSDRIIELGYLLIEVDVASGRFTRILSRYDGFEDPGFPLSPEIVALTGLTDADVAGKRLDDDLIRRDLAMADVVCAHNASFDRGFLERRIPEFASAWWCCSLRECPWVPMQTGTTKLEFLAYRVMGVFYDAHRALNDVEVLTDLLTYPAHDQRPILLHLVERARRMTHRVWATDAPFDKKDVLKLEKGYRWSDGSDPDMPIKAWYRDDIDDINAELDMLSRDVYGGKGRVTTDTLGGRERFTSRYRTRTVTTLPVEANQP